MLTLYFSWHRLPLWNNLDGNTFTSIEEKIWCFGREKHQLPRTLPPSRFPTTSGSRRYSWSTQIWWWRRISSSLREIWWSSPSTFCNSRNTTSLPFGQLFAYPNLSEYNRQPIFDLFDLQESLQFNFLHRATWIIPQSYLNRIPKDVRYSLSHCTNGWSQTQCRRIFQVDGCHFRWWIVSQATRNLLCLRVSLLSILSQRLLSRRYGIRENSFLFITSRQLCTCSCLCKFPIKSQ